MEAKSDAVRKAGCSEGLELLKRQFEQWRAGRVVGQRIPSELWAGAVAAAAEHGAYRVAPELHLDYAALKRRAARAGGTTRFTRYEAIAALRNAVYACALDGVTRLSRQPGHTWVPCPPRLR